jgi:CheY-like chemotaxis protein
VTEASPRLLIAGGSDEQRRSLCASLAARGVPCATAPDGDGLVRSLLLAAGVAPRAVERLSTRRLLAMADEARGDSAAPHSVGSVGSGGSAASSLYGSGVYRVGSADSLGFNTAAPRGAAPSQPPSGSGAERPLTIRLTDAQRQRVLEAYAGVVLLAGCMPRTDAPRTVTVLRSLGIGEALPIIALTGAATYGAHGSSGGGDKSNAYGASLHQNLEGGEDDGDNDEDEKEEEEGARHGRAATAGTDAAGMMAAGAHACIDAGAAASDPAATILPVLGHLWQLLHAPQGSGALLYEH